MNAAVFEIAEARDRKDEREVQIAGRALKLVRSGSSTSSRVDVFEPRKDLLGNTYWKECGVPTQKELLLALHELSQRVKGGISR